MVIFLFAFGLMPVPAYAGADSFDEALEVFETIAQNGDTDAFLTMISPEGIKIGKDEYSQVEFQDLFDTNDEISVDVVKIDETRLEIGARDLFFGDEQVFDTIDGIKLTHYEKVENGAWSIDGVMAKWEHGELDTFMFEASGLSVMMIPPLMRYALVFHQVDEQWYLHGLVLYDIDNNWIIE